MAEVVQQKAKSLAAKKLSSSQFNYDRDVDRYTTQNQNNANSRFDQLYDRQLSDSRRTAQQSTQIQDRRRNEDYARQQVNVDADRQEAANIRARQSTPGGSYSESFGLGAAASGGYSNDAFGVKSFYDASAVANWRNRQDGVLNDMYTVQKRSSDLDRDKQDYLGTQENNRNIDMMNRQASIKSQSDANQYLRQSQEGDKDRANQRYLAQLEANSRLQQSIFSGNGNGFQYWGGSI